MHYVCESPPKDRGTRIYASAPHHEVKIQKQTDRKDQIFIAKETQHQDVNLTALAFIAAPPHTHTPPPNAHTNPWHSLHPFSLSYPPVKINQ